MKCCWLSSSDEYEETHEGALGDEMQELHCWLESEPGQEFRFCVDRPKLTKVDGEIQQISLADGITVRKRPILSDGWCQSDKPHTSRTSHMFVMKDGQTMEAPMSFALLPVTDDLTAAAVDTNARIGTISLELKSGTYKFTGMGNVNGFQTADMRPVHEGSKKGLIGLRVEPGRLTPQTERNLYRFTRHSSKHKRRRSHAFTFRYRTKAYLASHHIIELPPHEPTQEERQAEERARKEGEEGAQAEAAEEARIAELEVLEAELNRLRTKRRIKTEFCETPTPKRRTKGTARGQSVANPIVLDD
ncbi:hypothetical protein M231_02244 [Tremella mesenterica]|uniref:DUF7918 domain-containing protein n=1 Tax=Tremella mesenterica TaxID=5217 RepID=A0A4Q1BR24_TREME|nr:hypothetical protein M231_02244 [Tremella mesenterica]